MSFTWDDRELSLTQISEKIGLAKSTTLRLLGALESEGFIEKNYRSNHYKLGHNLYYLGLIAKDSLDIRTISRPFMENITQLTKETANLYLLDHYDRVCFDQVESPLSIKRTVRIGERYPIWAGATGKSILAFMDVLIWEKMKDRIEKTTEYTITDPDEFIKELEKIRNLGFAVSVGEKDYEVGCVAAPIFDSSQKVVGCISISGPKFRFPADTDYFAKLVLEASQQISRQLGYYSKNLMFAE
jgi:DNA-binding IclR family transcriptional regulator